MFLVIIVISSNSKNAFEGGYFCLVTVQGFGEQFTKNLYNDSLGPYYPQVVK